VSQKVLLFGAESIARNCSAHTCAGIFRTRNIFVRKTQINTPERDKAAVIGAGYDFRPS